VRQQYAQSMLPGSGRRHGSGMRACVRAVRACVRACRPVRACVRLCARARACIGSVSSPAQSCHTGLFRQHGKYPECSEAAASPAATAASPMPATKTSGQDAVDTPGETVLTPRGVGALTAAPSASTAWQQHKRRVSVASLSGPRTPRAAQQQRGLHTLPTHTDTRHLEFHSQRTVAQGRVGGAPLRCRLRLLWFGSGKGGGRAGG
jgi:hypothetical protein